MSKDQFILLYHAYLEDRISPQDLQLFREHCDQPPYAQWFDELLENTISIELANTDLPDVDLSHMRHHLLQNVVGVRARKTPAKFYYAAAASLLILLAAAFYLWLKPSQAPVATNIDKKGMPPAKEVATLTMADGSTILLDSIGLQDIPGIAGLNASSDGPGNLRIHPGDASVTSLNQLTTPRGTQFKLTLPDGTRAWLNAASSIQFPTVFTGQNRLVRISGEVYFEVKKDRQSPFLVESGGATVEVLGTSFNINAYADEGKIVTTLVEGSIRVKAGKTVQLEPGQQAIMLAPEGSGLADPKIVNGADIQKVVAWKNGFFNFDNVPIREAMKQLERWYDIDVKYEGPVPDIIFRGGMDRDVKLSGIIRFLDSFGINARLEGKVLHIYRK